MTPTSDARRRRRAPRGAGWPTWPRRRSGGRAGVRLLGRGVRRRARFRSFADADGGAARTRAARRAARGQRRWGCRAHVSLAGTVFALPTDEARGRVALFLVLTIAPFVLLAPLIGPLLDRFRHGRRWALGTTLATRAFLAWVLATAVVEEVPGCSPPRWAAWSRSLVRRGPCGGRAAAAAPGHLPGHGELCLNIAGLIGCWPAAGSPVPCRGSAGLVCGWRSASTSPPPSRDPAAARVDSTAGELDLDGTAAGADALRCPPPPGRPAAGALPPAVRYVPWLTTGSRLLSGFLALFLAFLCESAAARLVRARRAGHGRGGRRIGTPWAPWWQPAPQPCARAARHGRRRVAVPPRC